MSEQMETYWSFFFFLLDYSFVWSLKISKENVIRKKKIAWNSFFF